MASSSASSGSSSFIHDVFLSFRGEDTRCNFTGFLHSALKREGINVFIDSEGLWGGDEIQTALLDAIQQSKISIPIFSKRYADSKWCLMELVEIVRCHRTNGQKVLPIFLDVEPREVRHQTGQSFEGSFQKHMKRYDEQTIQSWKEALTVVAGMSGYELKQENGNQAKLVKLVVDWALSELSINHLGDIKNSVGLNTRVQDLLFLLNVGSNDVRFVGICGIGGIGKTSIATTVYNRIFKRFEMSCFLANVREEASPGTNGLISLQKKLIYTVSKKKEEICNVYEGQELIKKKLRGKNVLLILDDVDSYSQLTNLAVEFDLYGPGSRIIIISRDEHILNVAQVDKDYIYWPNELDDEQSLQLFSLYAFLSDQPPQGYKQLSCDVIDSVGGLPLTLEVLGLAFYDIRDEELWHSMLQKLKKIPHEEVQKKLKLSYENLRDDEKSMFLDAACFFVGWKKETVISMWKARGFDPLPAIKKLTQRSLLKFTEKVYYTGSECSFDISYSYEELSMHDQIQAMGRGIVFEESPVEPSERSRLWSVDEILEVLGGHNGTNMIEGIYPAPLRRLSGICLHREDFVMMSKLRILYIDGAQSEGDFPHLPSSLTWFSWKGCPLKVLPTNFYLKKLVHMDLSGSKIRQAWTEKPPTENKFQKLKVLHLKYCHGLSESPNFSWFPYLEILDLKGCNNMVDLHKSIGDLKSLVEIYLDETKIKELPNSICRLSSLKHLSLKLCSSLEEIPNNIGMLSSLKKLVLTDCESLNKLPESIGDLKSLVEFLLGGTNIEELPNSICRLSSLKRLSLNRCESLYKLPESIGELSSLVDLQLVGAKIKEVSNGVGLLENLEELIVMHCNSLVNLPISGDRMRCLRIMLLQGTGILPSPDDFLILPSLVELKIADMLESSLPFSGGSLPRLQTLVLKRCGRLESLPELPSSLISLEIGDCISLQKLPNLSSLKKLAFLSLENCNKLEEIQGLEGTESLQGFFMGGCDTMVDSPRNIHGQGKLLVNGLSRSDSLNVNISDGTYKGLILCLVFELEDRILPQRKEVENLLFLLQATIVRKNRWTHYVTSLRIQGIKFTAKRDTIYIHHFKGFDWFGFPLEGADAIEDIKAAGGLSSSFISCELKFWKLLLVSTESEQQMPDQEFSAKMVEDFFSWSYDDTEGSPSNTGEEEVMVGSSSMSYDDAEGSPSNTGEEE